MVDESRETKQPGIDRQDEYMKGGKGRKDQVGGSGIYPASDPNAPPDAEVRAEGELGGPGTPRPKRTNEQDVKKTDLSSGSE